MTCWLSNHPLLLQHHPRPLSLVFGPSSPLSHPYRLFTSLIAVRYVWGDAKIKGAGCGAHLLGIQRNPELLRNIMAKPLSSSSPECPPPSLPASCSAWADQGPSYHSRHRRRRKPKSSQSVAPSPGLLVLLASVASASTAGGSPAPPVFLCPSINANGLCGPTPAVSSSSAAATITPSPPDSSTFLATSGRHLPDQFRPDSNGMWRRVPTYTLFGSTVTVNCDSVRPVSPVWRTS